MDPRHRGPRWRAPETEPRGLDLVRKTRMRATAGRSAWSVSSLSVWITLGLGLLIVALSATLLISLHQVWRTTGSAVQNVEAAFQSEDVDRSLRDYHRLSNVWLTTGAPEVDAARATERAVLQQLLVRMVQRATTEEDAQGVASLMRSVQQYLVEWDTAERQGQPLPRILEEIDPFFDRALAASAALRERSRRELERDTAAASDSVRLATTASSIGTLLLLAGLLAVVLASRRHVLRPILDLERCMKRFREGDEQARVKTAGLRELHEVSEGFNELVQTIVHQRKGELTYLAAVAHDLRDPLSVLKLIAHELAMRCEAMAPRQAQLFDRQVDRLTRMVGDLLDATRIQSGELELKIERLDLRQTVHAMVDIYNFRAGQRVSAQIPEDPVWVRADAARLEQVIGNLLSNAFKFDPTESAVEVVLSREADSATIAVSDRGVGIPADEIPRIFLPFRRWPGTADMAPGVGLGLSVAKRIIEAHGGHIDVESAPGVGSTFRVHLPLYDEILEAPGRPAAGPSLADDRRVNGPSK
jgi:two-component system sensor histidine kinase MtrB